MLNEFEAAFGFLEDHKPNWQDMQMSTYVMFVDPLSETSGINKQTNERE